MTTSSHVFVAVRAAREVLGNAGRSLDEWTAEDIAATGAVGERLLECASVAGRLGDQPMSDTSSQALRDDDVEPFGFSVDVYAGALQVDLPQAPDGLLIARGDRDEVIAEFERFIDEAQHALAVLRAGGTRRAEMDPKTGFTGRYVDEMPGPGNGGEQP